MSREKQIEKASKRQEYLKFKPFADDLRKAESWCELDGVLNRYQTVKNLSKMGYRKQSEGEWIWTENGTEDYEQYWLCSCCNNKSYWKSKFCEECGAKMKGGEE